jgi:hypothetical protein
MLACLYTFYNIHLESSLKLLKFNLYTFEII